MKKSIPFLLLILIVIASCKKESDDTTNTPPTVQKGISYPDSIYYGKNILNYPDSSLLLEGIDYEIGAVLEKDESFYVIFNNFPATDTSSGHQTEWFYANETGWSVGTYNSTTNTQIFTTPQTGKISAQISFSAYGQTGNCRIDFYENGNTVTRTKHFTWN